MIANMPVPGWWACEKRYIEDFSKLVDMCRDMSIKDALEVIVFLIARRESQYGDIFHFFSKITRECRGDMWKPIVLMTILGNHIDGQMHMSSTNPDIAPCDMPYYACILDHSFLSRDIMDSATMSLELLFPGIGAGAPPYSPLHLITLLQRFDHTLTMGDLEALDYLRTKLYRIIEIIRGEGSKFPLSCAMSSPPELLDLEGTPPVEALCEVARRHIDDTSGFVADYRARTVRALGSSDASKLFDLSIGYIIAERIPEAIEETVSSDPGLFLEGKYLSSRDGTGAFIIPKTIGELQMALKEKIARRTERELIDIASKGLKLQNLTTVLGDKWYVYNNIYFVIQGERVYAHLDREMKREGKNVYTNVDVRIPSRELEKSRSLEDIWSNILHVHIDLDPWPNAEEPEDIILRRSRIRRRSSP